MRSLLSVISLQLCLIFLQGSQLFGQSLNITKIVADFERPYVYAVNEISGGEDTLLVVSVPSEQIVKSLPIGEGVTDLTIHYGEDRLYVTNWRRPTTPVVDLTIQTLLPPLSLGTDVYKINAGRTGRIYYENEDQWIGIHFVNTADGTQINSFSAREGDGEIDPTGQYYYHCDNNISNAHITKYNISSDNPNPPSFGGSLEHPYGSRNLILSGDGSRLFWRGYVYDANLNELRNLGDEIYATTLHGDLAFSQNHVFNANTGQSIYTLPFSSTVMAVSGDQNKLFAYNGTSHQLMVIPMSDIAPIPGPGANPLPTDRSSIVLPLEKLSWSLNPSALRYQVYFGSDSATVASADSTSPEYLGSVMTEEIALSRTLDLEARYYWRIDLVGFSLTTVGSVWSFTVAPIVVTPNQIHTWMVPNGSDQQVSMTLTAGGQVLNWSVTESIPWLELDHSSGQTPDSLVANIHIGGLAVGVYTDTLRFTSGSYAFAVPVTLELFAMTLSKMTADLERPYIYALHPGSGGFNNAFLLFISTETNEVKKVLPIGSNPTDLTINYGENRLYVTNWQRPLTQIVDLTTQTPLPPLALGNDVYKINAGRSGRIYYEEQDQWVNIYFVNTATGARVNSFFAREGDGEIDPTGQYYYHCDNNSSDAAITKFNISSDNPNPPSFGRSLPHPGGSRNLILSADGSRLFWLGSAYDTNLTILRNLGEEIYATTLHGELAFGQSKVYNTHTGDVIHTLPLSTTVMAVSGDQTKLFAYNGTSHQLEVFPMSDNAPIPGPGANPSPANGSTIILPLVKLSWSLNPLAMRYQVYFGSDSATVASADSASPEYLGSVTASEMALSQTLALGAVYHWRVDLVGFSQTTAGPVWSFTVAPIVVAPNQIYMRMVTHSPDQRVNLVLTARGQVIPWGVSESIPWLELNHSSGQTPDSLVATFQIGGLSPGVYTDTLHFTSGSYAFAVPVTLELFAMTLSKMAADRERPYIYALHPGSSGFNNAFLLFISTETNQVVKVLPIGSNPTDLTIHYGEGRLYVTNWQRPTTPVVDLTTQTLLPPLALGNDIYKINAGRPGRIYYEEEDQWINIYFVNTANGARVNSFFAYEGDGEIDPTGQYYYHCENDISNAAIIKYNISSDNPNPPSFGRSREHPYGSRNLILCGDGSRLFWRGYVYDANLNELRNLGEEIYVTTLHGDLAFGQSKVYNTHTGNVVHTLPLSTPVMAVSGDQTKLFAYDGASHQLVVIPMSNIYVPTLGDLDGDGAFTLADVVFELNCVFFGTGYCPFNLADVNCDGQFSATDIVLELNAVFLSAPLPC